jgi:alpha-L-rhamnosidase
MLDKFLSALCLLLSFAAFAGAVQVAELRCEHLENPIGIGFRHPRLSWKLQSQRLGEVQTAYQIRAAASAGGLKNERPDLWDSDKIVSAESVLVRWAGKPLDSRAQVFWQVRVWDKDGQPSDWSGPAVFELGLLAPTNEWKGKWITADLPRYDIEQEILAKSCWISAAGTTATQATAARFPLVLPTNAAIRTAIFEAAADGLITIYVNGQPNQQGSSSRTAPLRADVRTQLVPGTNFIAINSAAVRSAVQRNSAAAGRNAIAFHGSIQLENGRRIEFDADGSWKTALAPTGNWFAAGFDDSTWLAATVPGHYADQPSKYTDNTIGPGRYLRKSFNVRKSIVKARLYATALGVYEATINGRRVSDSVLDPGWTDYNQRVMVQTHDVTRLLCGGANSIGVVLADGWYAGRVGWMGLAQYGTRPVFSAQLEITHADGSTDVIATDASWKAGAGEVVGSDAQWGEVIDARKAIVGWDKSSCDDSSWKNAVVEQHSLAFDPQLGPPIRRLMELPPQKISRQGDSWIVDFGQNMVGWVRLSGRGPAGTAITVRHAEILNPDGTLYTVNLRPARSLDTFILKGGREREAFEPHFTFHGFRYVEVSGYPGELTRDDLRGIVVGSDLPRTGTFECSKPELNRLYENIIWGQRGNFLSVPTDCPQRDERMGWTGDAQVFAPTAARNFEVAPFFTKWMTDVTDAQGTNGGFTTVAPRANQNQSWPVWGDAGVIIPWAMFTAYGDRDFLATHYSAMTRWLEFNVRRANDLILSGGVGDHLAPSRTPVEVVNTAYFANSAGIIAKAAALLGKKEDAERFAKLRDDIIAAFNAKFVSADGKILGDTQTAYILALQFELLPEHLRAAAARRLAENVETNGHLTTGFVGVGLICPTLTQIGRSDLAWQLVLTDTYPSWLFSVKNGATTIWERWDGWTPERGFQDPAMNSFNHYSFGSVGAWFYSGAAGIRADESHPGYKHFFLQPQFTPRLSHVKVSLDSPYGIITSHWHTKGDQLHYDVTIPPNTSAELVLPVPPENVRQSGKPLAEKRGTVTRLPLVAGTYQFSFPRQSIRPPHE